MKTVDGPNCVVGIFQNITLRDQFETGLNIIRYRSYHLVIKTEYAVASKRKAAS